MDINEIPSERRLALMYKDNPNFSKDDLRKVYFAFEKLVILKKMPSQHIMTSSEKVFYADIDVYREKMDWINEFMKSKGFKEVIFTDPSNYNISSDDYDYYYELKTPEQIKEEEAKRNAKNKEDGRDQRSQ